MKKIENTVSKVRIQFHPADVYQFQIREGTEAGQTNDRIIEIWFRDTTSFSLFYDVGDSTQAADYATDKSTIDALITS